jgi:glycosyltransferase involved in cell wall biosynthesis
MKIAQVAPLIESVPPKRYGGTERIVSYLTEALVAMGHDVTLYASGDSETNASLRPACSRSLRLNVQSTDPIADHVYLAEMVFRESANYDVIHSHIDYIGYPLWRRMLTPHLSTLHGRLDIVDLKNLYKEFAELPLVSISDFQRKPLADANWLATVHHGLPQDLYSFHDQPNQYLAFLGRISPEKRPDRAIEIARRANIPLKIAAKVDKNDFPYFEKTIKPLLAQPGVEYVGEIRDDEKEEFLGNALALLFPIDWPEPFGLVMIEAMACGTPVIANRSGSVPEVMSPETGYIVENVDEAVTAVGKVREFDRRKCRGTFEKRFTATRMAHDYLDLYEAVGGPSIDKLSRETRPKNDRA